MEHYICTGTDKGVSDTLGVCGGEGCSKQGEELIPCDCQDGKHYGKQGPSAGSGQGPSEGEHAGTDEEKSEEV